MPDKPKRKALITPNATAMFVYVWEPRESINEGQAPQYSISLMFKKSQLTDPAFLALKKGVKDVEKEKFGTKLNGVKSPFRDIDEMENPPQGFKGGVFITAKSKSRPGIVDADLAPITDEMEFYPGCICRASVTPWPFDKKGSKGVTFLLNNIQKKKDGTRLDGRVKAEDEFAEADDGDDEDDPLS